MKAAKSETSGGTARGTILFTGGGTGGHATPNLPLMARMTELGWRVAYVGSYAGIEREIIERAGVSYHPISTGKLRRYFSVKNFTDPFRIIRGFFQALWIVLRHRPRAVFSKGGFVAFPVVAAAWLSRVPVIIHESDLSPGLATKLSARFARAICITFPETAKYFPGDSRVVVAGTPVRSELLRGAAAKGLAFCGFSPGRPVLLVFGGSQGAERINKAVHAALDPLLEVFQIAHICGRGKIDPALDGRIGYRQFEYLHDEFADVIASAQVVVSRAGSNSLIELWALAKPNLLIPLGRRASRGDQILNAEYFARLGFSKVLIEEELAPARLVEDLKSLLNDAERFRASMAETKLPDTVKIVTDLLTMTAR